LLTSEIRLIVQSEGLEIINNIVKSQKDIFLSNMLNRVTNRIDLNSITYLAWDYAKEKEVNVIKKILKEIEKQDYSYSISISKPFKWIDIKYMNKKRYIFIPSAKSTIDYENNEQGLYNYLNDSDKLNIKGA